MVRFRDLQMDWMWAVREKKESRITTRILACATGQMVVPFINMGGNHKILVRVGRGEHILNMLNCKLDLKGRWQ